METAAVAFVAQDKPLYRRWSVADLLRFGSATNPSPRCSCCTVPPPRWNGWSRT
ncbi:hypothetical protein [Nonomuraea rhodomycinica]|uniref:hypothetical protein n=1 Tax=Nonomuraea rhodomycinica TaxID=1712872 RepID=UPI001FE3C085|nr:hypothetical protein [Nonomuraea rhodomycinica]